MRGECWKKKIRRMAKQSTAEHKNKLVNKRERKAKLFQLHHNESIWKSVHCINNSMLKMKNYEKLRWKTFFLFAFFLHGLHTMEGALSRKLHWQGMKLNHSLLTTIKFITSSVVRINFYILLFMCIYHNDLEFGAAVAGAFSSFNGEKRWNTISSTFSKKFYHARLAKWLPHKCFRCLLTVCFWLHSTNFGLN